MATQYSKITPTAYNNARTQVVGVLGATTTGTTGATQGYGQTPASSAVSQFEKITEIQLDNLRLDIIKAHTHQNGTAPTITNVALGDIETAAVFTSYETLASAIDTNKDTIAENQRSELLYKQEETYAAYEGVPNTGGGWKNYADYELKVTFADADSARYFFNSGSSFLFLAARTGGTTSPTIGLDQNTSWSQLLNLVTADQPTFSKSDFYSLTNAYQQVYIKYSTTSGYTANYYKISAKSNVADNSQGGATEFTFKVEFIDAYNDGNSTNYDGVDGKFTSLVYRYMPKGAGAGGAVTVASPSSVVATPSIGFSEAGTPIYITAAYTISNTTPATSQDEGAKTFTFAFNATNYNVPNTVTWTITASSTTSLVDFVQTGWTVGPDNPSGYKTLTRTTPTTGSYAVSTSSVSVTTFADNLTEGDETFTITAVGSADGSGGGFPSNELTITVTDSSKTPTPGITIVSPSVAGPETAEITCIPGESYGTTNTWTISSSALTGTLGLIVYGLYLDISSSPGINAYKLTLPSAWGGTIITETSSTYYTLETPQTIASGSSVTITIQVSSTSGSVGLVSAALRVKSNAGSAAGSGPAPAPNYRNTAKTVTIRIVQPTVTLNLVANPSSVSYTYVSGSSGSADTTVTLTNSGNARATITSYTVSSPGGSVSPGSMTGVILAGGTKQTTITYSSTSAYSAISQVAVVAENSLIGTANASRNISVQAVQAFGILGTLNVFGVVGTGVEEGASAGIYIVNTGTASLTITNITLSTTDPWVILGSVTNRPTTIAAGGESNTAYFLWQRSRIGSGNVTVTVTSNSGGTAGTTTSVSQSFSATAKIPTISVSSSNGSVVNSNSFATKAVIKKLSYISVTVSNLPLGGYVWVAPQWESGYMHQSFIDRGITTPIGAFGSTVFGVRFQSATANGGIVLWSGQDPQETRAWQTGVGRIWLAIQNGVYDNGTQSYYIYPGRGGNGSSESVNQFYFQLEIVPNMVQSLTVDTEFISNLDPGTNATTNPAYSWSLKGGPSNAIMYAKNGGWSDTNFPGVPPGATEGATQLDVNGEATMASNNDWIFEIRTISRQFRADYKGTEYVSNISTLSMKSPAFYVVGGSYAWVNPVQDRFADVGIWFRYLRRLSPLVVGRTYRLDTIADDHMNALVRTDQDGLLLGVFQTDYPTPQSRTFVATRAYAILEWNIQNDPIYNPSPGNSAGNGGSFSLQVFDTVTTAQIYSTSSATQGWT